MADPRPTLDRLEDKSVCAHLLSKLKYTQANTRTALAVEFDKIGLTTPQFLALAAIDENADISSAELARQSFVSPQAMITIVARLEGAGLITRTPATGGGRTLTMRLTEEGVDKLEQARAHAYAIERYILDLLGSEKYDALLDSLDTITDALSQATTYTKSSPWDVYVDEAEIHTKSG
jgi:DNA-binding MarR family transcriptional regulator